MENRVAQRAANIKPSPTLAVTAKAAELKAAGRDIIALSAGEPDFDTPEHIKEAAIKAIRDGKTKYTAAGGMPELKQAVADKFRRENNLVYGPDQILVSCGAKHSIYNVMQALLNPGDEVIIPSPYWVSYPDMAKLAGAEPVAVRAGIRQRFKITGKQLERSITGNTRLVMFNSPSNPTGVSYSDTELAELAAVLVEHPEIVVLTDDIYEHILWGQDGFRNILNVCPDLADRTVVVNGVSKAYSMTGWRIGYLGGPPALVKAAQKIQSQSTSNPSSVSQYAALAALNGDQTYINESTAIFKQRHDFVHAGLNAIDGVDCTAADGTFYSFPNMQGVIDRLDGIKNDIELGEYLLEQAEVALVPGSAFGAKGYMRLSYATSMENLETAIERLRAALD
ncbi:MAG: pyridoxal phosphate-dependent aminotransferase [Gammaproteobacteria bacterium]|nr:pyridoxal phosphate-dependent aminotransferase [Gammaproteobacteria bacterium]